MPSAVYITFSARSGYLVLLLTIASASQHGHGSRLKKSETRNSHLSHRRLRDKAQLQEAYSYFAPSKTNERLHFKTAHLQKAGERERKAHHASDSKHTAGDTQPVQEKVQTQRSELSATQFKSTSQLSGATEKLRVKDEQKIISQLQRSSWSRQPFKFWRTGVVDKNSISINSRQNTDLAGKGLGLDDPVGLKSKSDSIESLSIFGAGAFDETILGRRRARRRRRSIDDGNFEIIDSSQLPPEIIASTADTTLSETEFDYDDNIAFDDERKLACPKFARIEKCINYDQERTVCDWSIDSNECEKEMNYTLYYMKRSNPSVIYRCNPKTEDSVIHSLAERIKRAVVGIARAFGPGRGAGIQETDGQLRDSCSLGKEVNVHVTHEFFVTRWYDSRDASKSIVPSVQQGTHGNIFVWKGEENFVVTYPPEHLRARSESGGVFLNWEPPNKNIYRFDYVKLIYRVRYRKQPNAINLAICKSKESPCSEDDEDTWTYVDVPEEGGTSHTITAGLVRGDTYQFEAQARARDAANVKTWSGTSNTASVYIKAQLNRGKVNASVIVPGMPVTPPPEPLVVTADPEKEERLSVNQVSGMSFLAITCAVIFILLGYVITNRNRLKRYIISEIPQPHLLVRLGHEDRGLLPSGKKKKKRGGGGRGGGGNDNGFNDRGAGGAAGNIVGNADDYTPMNSSGGGAIHHAVSTPVQVAVSLMNSSPTRRAMFLRNSAQTAEGSNQNANGGGGLERASLIGTANGEQQWDTVRSPLVAQSPKPDDQLLSDGATSGTSRGRAASTVYSFNYDSGSGYPAANNGSGGGVYPKINQAVILPATSPVNRNNQGNMPASSRFSVISQNSQALSDRGSSRFGGGVSTQGTNYTRNRPALLDGGILDRQSQSGMSDAMSVSSRGTRTSHRQSKSQRNNNQFAFVGTRFDHFDPYAFNRAIESTVQRKERLGRQRTRQLSPLHPTETAEFWRDAKLTLNVTNSSGYNESGSLSSSRRKEQRSGLDVGGTSGEHESSFTSDSYAYPKNIDLPPVPTTDDYDGSGSSDACRPAYTAFFGSDLGSHALVRTNQRHKRPKLTKRHSKSPGPRYDSSQEFSSRSDLSALAHVIHYRSHDLDTSKEDLADALVTGAYVPRPMFPISSGRVPSTSTTTIGASSDSDKEPVPSALLSVAGRFGASDDGSTAEEFDRHGRHSGRASSDESQDVLTPLPDNVSLGQLNGRSQSTSSRESPSGEVEGEALSSSSDNLAQTSPGQLRRNSLRGSAGGMRRRVLEAQRDGQAPLGSFSNPHPALTNRVSNSSMDSGYAPEGLFNRSRNSFSRSTQSRDQPSNLVQRPSTATTTSTTTQRAHQKISIRVSAQTDLGVINDVESYGSSLEELSAKQATSATQQSSSSRRKVVSNLPVLSTGQTVNGTALMNSDRVEDDCAASPGRSSNTSRSSKGASGYVSSLLMSTKRLWSGKD